MNSPTLDRTLAAAAICQLCRRKDGQIADLEQRLTDALADLRAAEDAAYDLAEQLREVG